MAHSNSAVKPGAQARWQQRISEGMIAAEASHYSKWIEALVIPLLAMALTWLVNPQDPLTRNATFPWLWLAALLVALRYGVLPGLVSGLLILMGWPVFSAAGLYATAGTADFPREFFFAGALLILLGGEFSDVWRDRLNRIDETNLYLVERLSGLTRRHLLLNLSHDRLEQEMLARPGSLRDAVVRLRAVVVTDKEPQHVLPGVNDLLNLLTQYVNIEAAALYRVHNEGRQLVPGEKLAGFGETRPLRADDELFVLAMETQDLAHIAALDLSLERTSDQLVVAPLVSSGGEMVGVLAVSKLPFFSLNVENLQMMSVILSYYADCVTVAPAVSEIRQQIPIIPPVHAEELGRLLHMHRTFHIPSQIVVLTFCGERRFEMPAELMRIKRGLDLYWETSVAGNPSLVVIMPFASESAREGFLERIGGWMKTCFGMDMEAQEVDVRTIDFASGDPLAALARVLQP
ncbi:MAG: hypothetical protein KBD39_07175 [Sterolibacterium sp.]|nr:hypothetical protein [Sterolibacterium sp.]MBP9799884.1 hypothetical protein [Sterolibacterium sp.]